MKQTAVEWLRKELETIPNYSAFYTNNYQWIDSIINEAKEMEKKKKLKHQLFIGKVSDIIGFDKTLELLKECNNTIK
jgi:hypothetical protein